MTPSEIHTPRIPGYELTDQAPTLALAWSRPQGEYPEELWPIALLRRVTPEPTGWLTVEEHFHRDDMYGGTHCVLADPGSQERVLGAPGWSGQHTIGEIELWSDGRFSDGLTAGEDPAQPDLFFFAAVREHHRLIDPTFEITPTFLWYWDAFPTAAGWSYLNAAGRDVEIIRTEISMYSWRIEVAALELRTFLGDAGRDLLVQMDYTTTIDHEHFDRIDHGFRSDRALFDWFALHQTSVGGRPAFSDVMGKYLIEGLKTSRRRRREERAEFKTYAEFVYGVDSGSGSMLTHTCDPAQLGDYRDNSKLHELTPVYFSREVLGRYADEPSRYRVTVSRLECLDLWGLDISTNTAGLIEVYLSELGSLPSSEQSHWVAHNVPPEGQMEEGRFRRDFLNQIAASPDPVGELRRARSRAADATKILLGSPLWTGLDAQTRGEFEHLVGPTTTDASSLGPPVLTLTKAMVDGIDPVPLKTFLGGAERGERSLALLGRFLEAIGDTEGAAEPFRALQAFRSAGGVAHLGGTKAAEARSRLGIDGLAPWPAFVHVVEQLTVALNHICDLVAAVSVERAAPPSSATPSKQRGNG
ncbi:MAG: hypothetical protein ABIW36_01885 [Terrimesophilobacter sp.]